MVAYADMLNHKLPQQTQWLFDDDRDAFVILAKKDIPEGAEVFDSYGPKPNDTLLMNYGFVIPRNPDDVIRLSYSPSNTDPMLALKCELLKINPSNPVVQIVLSANTDGKVFRENFCKIRLLLF